MTSSFNKRSSAQSDKPASIILFRWLGYGLLAFSLIDLITLIYPPNLMDPFWEFQTAGAVIDRIIIPLLAFSFIFFGEINYRRTWEILILKFFSWSTIPLGIICLILIPLILAANAQRLAQQLDAQSSNQFNEQIVQLERAEATVKETTDSELFAFLENQGATLDGQSPQTVKDELLLNLANTKQQLRSETQIQLSLRKTDLKKSLFKWTLGSIVAGFLFIYMWILSKWARVAPLGLPFFKTKSRKQRSI